MTEHLSLTPRVKGAHAFATAAHMGQERFTGENYITHPEAVAEIVYQAFGHEAMIESLLILALLHDVLEDQGEHIFLEELQVVDGFSYKLVLEKDVGMIKLASEVLLRRDEMGALWALTKGSKEPYDQYVDRCLGNALARKIKWADTTHNRSTLPEGHSLFARYNKTLARLDEVLSDE